MTSFDLKMKAIALGLTAEFQAVDVEIYDWFKLGQAFAAQKTLFDKGAYVVLLIPEATLSAIGYELMPVKGPFWKRLSRLIFGRLVWLNEK
jgi:hypothetical protein